MIQAITVACLTVCIYIYTERVCVCVCVYVCVCVGGKVCVIVSVIGVCAGCAFMSVCLCVLNVCPIARCIYVSQRVCVCVCVCVRACVCVCASFNRSMCRVPYSYSTSFEPVCYSRLQMIFYSANEILAL